MKNLITVLAVALFSAGMNMSAQETKPKEAPKKECTTKEKKACSSTSKKACCSAKTTKKA
ncbi:hypothetical protein [Flavobacterium gilvum]|uniref:Uncharacterized protein n=1 Tax=Flavobacterium gilvum TaxID=1492737 RepID=A0AAC9N6M4_9FLAO|nr:hypothetical protein [Flavobacterium gilvum]AOW11456.1 hypothetical protein EM308_15935 [Flavobacterium gilvum]